MAVRSSFTIHYSLFTIHYSEPATDDRFDGTEATDLLKTKDRAPGPNPLRTHFGNEEEKPSI